MVMGGSFVIGKLFFFIFAQCLLNGALYFSLKNLFCGKFFKLIFFRFLLTQSFSGKK
jgi:hypothetical protein